LRSPSSFGRHGGLMYSALGPGASSLGLPGILCCVLGQDSCLSQCLSLPRSINGYWQIVGKRNKLWGNDLRWTSILSRGSRNTPNPFMLQKLGISSSSYDPVGTKASVFLFFPFFLGVGTNTSICQHTW